VSKLANQWIEIFRAGDYGEQGSFSEADLDRVVANYQPSQGHEAPIVIGHPKENAPAFGWVEALKRVGKSLFAKPSQVDPQFESMCEEGKFKKRSASFYRTPDGKSIAALRHVGFLGAMPPVVKGLADCKFADDTEPQVFEFQENDMADVNEQSIVEKVFARFADAFSGKKGVEPVAASFSEDQVKQIAATAAQEAVTAAVKPLQEKLTAAEAKFSERETKLSTAETEQRATNAIAGLKAKGRWIPAFDKYGVPAVFSELAKATGTVEFGEGDQKKQVAPLDLLVEFMESLPKIVPAGEVYNGQQPGAPAAPKGVNRGVATVDQNSVRLHQATEEFAEKNKVEYGVAQLEVLKKHPELNVPGGAAIGQV